jgi:hypothetical protein
MNISCLWCWRINSNIFLHNGHWGILRDWQRIGHQVIKHFNIVYRVYHGDAALI